MHMHLVSTFCATSYYKCIIFGFEVLLYVSSDYIRFAALCIYCRWSVSVFYCWSPDHGLFLFVSTYLNYTGTTTDALGIFCFTFGKNTSIRSSLLIFDIWRYKKRLMKFILYFFPMFDRRNNIFNWSTSTTSSTCDML